MIYSVRQAGCNHRDWHTWRCIQSRTAIICRRCRDDAVAVLIWMFLHRWFLSHRRLAIKPANYCVNQSGRPRRVLKSMSFIAAPCTRTFGKGGGNALNLGGKAGRSSGIRENSVVSALQGGSSDPIYIYSAALTRSATVFPHSTFSVERARERGRSAVLQAGAWRRGLIAAPLRIESQAFCFRIAEPRFHEPLRIDRPRRRLNVIPFE